MSTPDECEEVFALYRAADGTDLLIRDPVEIPETVFLEDGSVAFDFIGFVDNDGERVVPTEDDSEI